MKTSVFWALFLSSLIACPLFLFADQALSIFGDSFREGGKALQILSIGRVFTNVVVILSALMVMIGEEKRAVCWSFLGVVITGIVGTMLIPYHGMLGAAVATMTGEIFKAGFLSLWLWHKPFSNSV